MLQFANTLKFVPLKSCTCVADIQEEIKRYIKEKQVADGEMCIRDSYYSGSQKQAFDELVDEFNETQGKKQGISVDAVAKGSISNISADLKSSLEKKVNAPELPNIFASYGDTAEDMEKAEKLVSINDYMSDKEMAEYVDDYMKDGILHNHDDVNIFPIAKATEVMVINKNIWDDFAKKEHVKLSDLDTWEGLAQVSEKYYTYCLLYTSRCV